MKFYNIPNTDEDWMRVALSFALRAQGQTMPNPAVGCVIVKNGVLLAAAHTARGGRPHAETQALQQAGDAARGATAYVTLEPCAHIGQTGACAQALINAGIARVVIAIGDPDARVNGRGIEMLRSAGIHVVLGVCIDTAAKMHRGFIKRMQKNLPFVTLKIASSLDGCITNKGGASKWITGEISRQHVHVLRAKHEAILTGIGTILADNPALDCRLEGLEDASPVRVVLDSALRIDLDTRLVKTAMEKPTYICTGNSYDTQKAQRLKELGITLFHADTPRPSGAFVMAALAQAGISSVLIEAGSGVATSMLEENMVDEIVWFRAPFVMGEGAKPALVLDGSRMLEAMQRFRLLSVQPCGTDVLEHYAVK